MNEILVGVPAPTPDAVKAAREAAGLSSVAAGQLLGKRDRGAWSKYECGRMELSRADFALFLLLTQQHPSLKVVQKEGA